MNIFISADDFVKSYVELSALSNGTTKTITVEANHKVTLDCFVQGNFFQKNCDNAPIRDFEIACTIVYIEKVYKCFFFEIGYRHSKVGWFLDTTQLETKDQESAYASSSSFSFEAQEFQGTEKIYTCQTENLEETIWARVKIIVEGET